MLTTAGLGALEIEGNTNYSTVTVTYYSERNLQEWFYRDSQRHAETLTGVKGDKDVTVFLLPKFEESADSDWGIKAILSYNRLQIVAGKLGNTILLELVYLIFLLCYLSLVVSQFRNQGLTCSNESISGPGSSLSARSKLRWMYLLK